jgi:signal transduction histidine kinase/ligand-binding sensor domain-containing protein
MQDTSILQRSLWLSAIYLLLLLARGYGLDPSRRISQYGHSIWRWQDGLVNAASPITQTTDGYIWIIGTNGLTRFDGVNFVPWTPPRDIPFSWRHFTALLGASDGSLWIGTSSGLGRLKEGHFRSYSKPGDRSGIGSIIEDHAGHIWVTRYLIPTGEGAICEAREDGLHCHGPADGVPLRYGFGLAEDTEGNFWIGSRYLCRWKPGSTCTIYFNNGPADADIDAGLVAAGSSQTIWAVVNTPGQEGGLQRFSAGKWASYSVPGLSTSVRGYEAMLADHDGSLWVGTGTDGLYRLHNDVVDHYGPADGLSGHKVGQIYEDHEGNLWVTTDGGMDMFRNTPVFSYSAAQGLSSADPRAILASQDGSIWITTSHGIEVLRDGHKQYLPAWPIRVQGTNSLFEDRTGTIWFSSGAGNDLVYWNHGGFHLLKPHNADTHGRFVTGITGDAQHNLWAVSQTYLFRIDQGQVQQYIPLPKNFAPVGLLASDLQGGIWISDRAAHLFRYSNGQFQTIELKDTGGPNMIAAMIADADDPLLVATAGGLFRWDGQRLTVLDTHNGLPCARIASLVKDNYGALWLGAPCGLLRIDPSELAKWRHDAGVKVAAKVLDRLDGAYPGGKMTVEPYATKAPDGRIWFTNGDEVETFDPDHLFENSVLPPVHIETVIADDKAYERSPVLRLPARTRNLEIDYTALSLSVPQKVRFRYRLEGQDPGWREVINERKVQYSNLPPRHYRFRVIAANNSGVWNEEGDTLEFDIPPAWYQTLWFRAICAVVFLVLLWGIYQLRIQELRRQFAIGLEARVNERTRIARDLHDTLLQSFHGLMLRFQAATNLLPERPVEAKQRFESAIDQAAQAITEGRDTVQGLRSSTVETNDLAMAISALREELQADGTIAESTLFRMAVEGTPRNLHPILRDEVYRIAGETLRNAFRHAQARQIEVEIHYDARQFRLRVRDDGKGIDPEILGGHPRPRHFGLHGMRERAKIVGGQLDIWSELDSGTEVELSIPASRAYATPSTRRSWWSRKGSEIKS